MLQTSTGDPISPIRFTAYVLIIACSVVLIYLFGFRGMRFFLVPSGSMEPTLFPGDYLITLTECPYRRGEIVVLKDPEQKGAYIVKRIVAVPGDRVAIEGGALMLNGKYASEPYIPEPMAVDLDPIQVGANEVFVLGDNRNESEDSSVWKRAVGLDTVIGRVRCIYYPFSRMGLARRFPLTNSEGE